MPSKDGCGSLGIGISTEYLPAAEMATCCDDHDICYDTCNKDKELCDLDFKRCLYSYCDKYEKSTVGGDIMVKGLYPTRRRQCLFEFRRNLRLIGSIRFQVVKLPQKCCLLRLTPWDVSHTWTLSQGRVIVRPRVVRVEVTKISRKIRHTIVISEKVDKIISKNLQIMVGKIPTTYEFS